MDEILNSLLSDNNYTNFINCLCFSLNLSQLEIKSMIDAQIDIDTSPIGQPLTLLLESYFTVNREDIIIERTKMLIDAGANVNCKNKKGDTPLRIVVGYNNFTRSYELIKMLIDAGANVNDTDSILYYAIRNYFARNILPDTRIKIIELLIDSGADLSVLMRPINTLPVIADNSDLLKLLLDEGLLRYMDVWNKTTEESFFDSLVFSGISSEDVKLLIDAKIDVNLASNSGKGYTPLMSTVFCKHKAESIKFLLEAKADITTRTGGEDVFDIFADGSREVEVLRLLMAEKEKILIRQTEQKTAERIFTLLSLEKFDVPNELKVDIFNNII